MSLINIVVLITSRFYFHFFFQVGSPLYSVCCWAYCCLLGRVYSHSPRKNKKPYSYKNVKKFFGTEEITPLNKIKAKFKKNLRTRRGNIAKETLFFSLLGVQTRERCSVGTKICTMEARMFIDLIQYYFFLSWERICVHAFCFGRGQNGKHFAAKSFIN